MSREDDIAISLSKQYGIPYASLENKILKIETEQNLERLIPEDFARENFVIPLFLDNEVLAVAIADPENMLLLDDLKRRTAHQIQPFIATKTQIMKVIDEYYSSGGA